MKANDFLKISVTVEGQTRVKTECNFCCMIFFDHANLIDKEDAITDLKECFKIIKTPEMITIDYSSGNTDEWRSRKPIKSIRFINRYGELKFAHSNSEGNFSEWSEPYTTDLKRFISGWFESYISEANNDFIKQLKELALMA